MATAEVHGPFSLQGDNSIFGHREAWVNGSIFGVFTSGIHSIARTM